MSDFLKLKCVMYVPWQHLLRATVHDRNLYATMLYFEVKDQFVNRTRRHFALN